MNSDKGIVVDKRISPGNWTQSRRGAALGRQQSEPRDGQRAGPHRSLRTGHESRGVIRELGSVSRLRGTNGRNEGDRPNQPPGVDEAARFIHEPNLAWAERDTKANAFTQGIGREPQADRPRRTKAVVATHSTAGPGITPVRKRGEPRPKGPTITLERAREGKAGHDVCAEERQEGP